MTDQNLIYQCSLLCEPRYKHEAAPVQPGQSPVRLIEKWAAENSKNQSEKDVLADVQRRQSKWSKSFDEATMAELKNFWYNTRFL